MAVSLVTSRRPVALAAILRTTRALYKQPAVHFGHYEVLQVLGKGGFGIVFRAFDEMLQRVVALKVLAPQLAATSPARSGLNDRCAQEAASPL